MTTTAPQIADAVEAPVSTVPPASAAYEVASPAHTPRGEWLDIRRTGIGSSDVAAALGLSPFKSQYALFLEKIGELDDNRESEAMALGRKLERFVAEEFAERFAGEVAVDLDAPQETIRSLAHPFMLSTKDFHVTEHGRPGILEIKTTGQRMSGDWAEFVPDHVQLQVQHQLAVSGLGFAWIAVMIGGQTIQAFRLDRDDALIADLIEGEARFWRHVETNTAPPLDGSDSTTEALRARFGEVTEGEEVELAADAADLLAERAALKEAVGEMEGRLAVIDQTFMRQLADAEIGLVDGRKAVTWKKSERRSVDTKALREAQPEIAEQFTRATSLRTLRYPTWKAS